MIHCQCDMSQRLLCYGIEKLMFFFSKNTSIQKRLYKRILRVHLSINLEKLQTLYDILRIHTSGFIPTENKVGRKIRLLVICGSK